ncbi:MAG: Tripartite tricarboxylate transporter family receptor [Paucimonas sp.]|jgi:tripartite-type tricarboxylate transporter receptor subunit TctC|nr:Tripartite tricarboxylate transporter family receptor [Paucimonas sp.]
MKRREIIKLGLLAATPSWMLAAQAQTRFPAKPIRLIVPFPAGGPTDVFARVYAGKLAAALGQAVVVDNRSGASGAIGSLEVKNAAPDGYTLLFGTASTGGLYNLLSRAPQYDSVRDFTHIAIVGGAPAAFAANPAMPQTLGAMLDMARATPGKMQYGSPGQGTYLHLAAEWLKKEAGNLDIQHIPYRGSAQALPALIGGQVAWTVDTLGSLLPNHKAGKLKIMAVASPTRLAIAPDVPTVDQAIGTKNFDAVLWNVVAGPAGLPANVLETLSAASTRAMNDPALQEQLASMAISPKLDSTPASATAYIKREMEKWRPVVQATGIKLE